MPGYWDCERERVVGITAGSGRQFDVTVVASVASASSCTEKNNRTLTENGLNMDLPILTSLIF